jgi:hypothetical protein
MSDSVIERGSRVRLSDEAANMFPASSRKVGTIVTESSDGQCWRILWDGNKSSSSFHKSFVVVLSD